jgi:hypothetical protein
LNPDVAFILREIWEKLDARLLACFPGSCLQYNFALRDCILLLPTLVSKIAQLFHRPTQDKDLRDRSCEQICAADVIASALGTEDGIPTQESRVLMDCHVIDLFIWLDALPT